jgi:malate dehydrogenase (oxaloacetate-decarboxylating)
MTPHREGHGPLADASHPVTMRVTAAPHRSLLPRLAHLVSAVGTVIGMDLVEVTTHGATVDLTVQLADDAAIDAAERLLERNACTVRHVSDRTFLCHLGGKIEVTPRVGVHTRQELSLAYTPGAGRVAAAISDEPADAWTLTAKGTSVAIVTDGSAVLGLGRLGPLAALPVMEGKSLLFKQFAGVNAYPICLDVRSPEALVDAACAISPGFGGINLEDVAAPACFEVEAELQRRLDIPVFHDDQHGTAAVVLAGLLNACRLTGRDPTGLRIVQVGLGAAGTAIAKALLAAGVTDLVAFDRDGVVTEASSAAHHASLAARSNPRGVIALRDALTDADVFIGTARRGSVDPQMLARMAPRPIVFALANPQPEAFPGELPADAVIATGRSDLPNQINNSLCFPGLFKGALTARATSVTAAMKEAATRAIADSVSEEELRMGVIVPSMFQPRVHERVAAAVAEAWANEHDALRAPQPRVAG